MSAVLALAGGELRQAARSRAVVVGGLVLAASATGISVLGGSAADGLGTASLDTTTAALLQVSVLLPPLLALVLGAGSLAGSRERGFLGMIAAQPVRRWSLVGAAYCGLASALGLVLAFGFGFSALALVSGGSAGALAGLAVLAAVSVGATAAALAAGLAISAWSRGQAEATGAAVGTWFAFSLGYDLVLAATVPAVDPSLGMTFLAIAVNPLEAARLLGLLLLDGGSATLGSLGVYLVDRLGVVAAAGICITSLVVWTVAGLSLATIALQRRDL
ncbi:MAG: ABC transporter permease [Acidimicrobiia bacterium]|nr:ABC transporter permease [Acidimicrobiia bacterium]